jgi:hypothetical protein
MLAQRALDGNAEPAAPRVAQSSCDLRESTPLLNQLDEVVILAPLDIGSTVLVNTHHAVVASGHHRTEEAMRDVIVSFTSPPDVARQHVAKHGADLVVVCTVLPESLNLAHRGGPESFMAQLLEGNHPDWLEPVDIGGPEEFKVWRVIRD